MSGHSKWSKVKHQKAGTDAVKGAAFTKASHAITIAIKEGANITDPEKNLEIAPEEVKNPDSSAYFVAQKIAEQLEKRMPHRYIVKKTIEKTMSSGAKGIKILLSGRIAGAEIARRETYGAGKIPLQTLRAKIDYAEIPSLTRSGFIGVKVWIYQGDKDASA